MARELKLRSKSYSRTKDQLLSQNGIGLKKASPELETTRSLSTAVSNKSNLSLGFEKERQLTEEIEEIIRRKERPTKIATLVERYNQLLDEMDKIDNQKSKHLKLDAHDRMRCRQNQRQTTGLGNVNKWMDILQKLKNENPSGEADAKETSFFLWWTIKIKKRP